MSTKTIGTLSEKMLLVFLSLRPALDYWRDIVIWQYKNTVLNLNAALAIIFIIWAIFILAKHWPLVKTEKIPLKLLLPVLLLLMITSAFYSISKFTTVSETIKFLALALFFFVSYVLIKQQKISKQELIIAIFASAVIPIIFGLAQLLTGSGIATFGLHGRIYGTFAHPNVFAFFLLTLIFLLSEQSIFSPTAFWQNRRLLRNFIFCALIILLLFTYTRAAWIGLIVFLLAIGIARSRCLLYALIAGLALFYLIFYPLNRWLIANYQYSLRTLPLIERLTSRDEDSDSIAWRLSLIQETAPIIRQRPFLGHGYGTFPLVWEANRGIQHFWDDSAEAHNDYLRLLLELGAIGLTLYLITLSRLFFISAKKYKLILPAWIIVFAIISLSDNMLHHTPVVWMTFSYWAALLAE